MFSKKPLIGMIHLAGSGPQERICRALKEMELYVQEGLDAAIIEDYHGTEDDVVRALRESSSMRLTRGVNLLRDPCAGYCLAAQYGAGLVQFDAMEEPHLNVPFYDALRRTHQDILVLGGVGFKYVPPTGNPLEQDLRFAMSRCDAIVTTGEGTGIATPLGKLETYRSVIGEFPLLAGAGVDPQNVADTLRIADGAIIGSCFKPEGDTRLPVDRVLVRELVCSARQD